MIDITGRKATNFLNFFELFHCLRVSCQIDPAKDGNLIGMQINSFVKNMISVPSVKMLRILFEVNSWRDDYKQHKAIRAINAQNVFALGSFLHRRSCNRVQNALIHEHTALELQISLALHRMRSIFTLRTEIKFLTKLFKFTPFRFPSFSRNLFEKHLYYFFVAGNEIVAGFIVYGPQQMSA